MRKLDPGSFTPQDNAVDDETLALVVAILRLINQQTGPGHVEKEILVARQIVQDYRQGKE